ncbi:glycine C-acetyltransferase [Alteriqipengyuania flavescens]|uniref:glycine C-acetyltransferase n=1 Tax=Alteriqipengyuania flavescens TaxID=3053610 RepID=UPI0025B3A5E8|nr:glycine C-acetyltransferase [Alteriqipengyuania flavescens]WJY19290.1 glycine C-acetyltransferase [Alteriqipengyuania flavescens]WJY25231.1 glycine C-acetyltransferase [Alteriqipengyuania flavescens]
MDATFYDHLASELKDIEEAGLTKHEREITSAQGPQVALGERRVINLCANDYLGLAGDERLRDAAREGLDTHGYGMASVRFICGTQDLHKEAEARLSRFLGFEDTILYPSCFDANGGLFEVLLGAEDAIISDELNHASIIDGVRLCKAQRYRYKNNDMADLEAQLKAADAAGARFKMITTDGVFSMDGYIARLDEICDLAEKYGAIVHFDDCHATGFLGATGRGTHEFRGCMDRVDITTGTLGKALGGASGGYTSAKKEVVALLRQRSRPYLFSNSVAPAVVSGALKALDIAEDGAARERLFANAAHFRAGLERIGLESLPGEHPIIPIMLYDAKIAAEFAQKALGKGVYVTAFSYPVVPHGKARIRTQMSSGLSTDDLDHALDAFAAIKAEMGI